MDEVCESLASMKIDTPIYLPHDVIEYNILSRLPAKSLLRLKAVCKQWSATISDPIFVGVHLQRSKNSISSSSLYDLYSNEELGKVALENRHIRQLSLLQVPQQLLEDPPGCGTRLWLREYRTWCYFDGLFLISYPNYRAGYVLWNPSCRRHKEVLYPYPVDNFDRSPPRIGIYNHHSDYKVVVVGDEHNAVFSCKNNSWSELRSNAISFIAKGYGIKCAGVTYKGSVYWIRYLAQELDGHTLSQVVCFDGKDEKLKIVCDLHPYACDRILFTSRDDLYVIVYLFGGEQPIITKVLPVWMEHEAQLPFPYMIPLCFTPENQVLFAYYDGDCLLYDPSGRETTTIHPGFGFRFLWDRRLFPCIQTLFLL